MGSLHRSFEILEALCERTVNLGALSPSLKLSMAKSRTYEVNRLH